MGHVDAWPATIDRRARQLPPKGNHADSPQTNAWKRCRLKAPVSASEDAGGSGAEARLPGVDQGWIACSVVP